VHKSWFRWLFKKFSEVAPQTSLDIAFVWLSEMLGNHCTSIISDAASGVCSELILLITKKHVHVCLLGSAIVAEVLLGRFTCTQCIDAFFFAHITHTQVCVCVYLGTQVSCAKMTEPFEIPFGGTNSCGPKEPCISFGVYSPYG